MKNKLQQKLLSSTDLYEAYGYLTALAAIGRFNVLWLNYYTWRIGHELEISDNALIEELQQRVRVELELPPVLASTISFSEIDWEDCVIEDSCFWELISTTDGYVLKMTTHTNVVWNSIVRTFAAPDWESAMDVCTTVFKIDGHTIKCL